MPGILRSLYFLPRLTARPLLPLTRGIMPLAPTRLAQPSFKYFSISRPPRASSPTPPHSPSSPSAPSSHEVQQTVSGRLKTLIKTYGWYALGVYVVFSTIDFGVAFLAINLLGASQVSYMASSIKSLFFDLIGRTTPAHTGEGDNTHHPTDGSEGLYAMIVLAYTIHKTLFLPIRVGLTAAFTPKFVNWLGRRGWVGTDGARRAGREIRDRVRRGSTDSNSP